MALPELPDDRRARPQRFSPAGPSGGRHAVRTPPEGHPVTSEGRVNGTGHGPHGGGTNGSGVGSDGRPAAPGRPPLSGRPPLGGPPRFTGRSATNGGPSGTGLPVNGGSRVTGGPPRNGDPVRIGEPARNGEPIRNGEPARNGGPARNGLPRAATGRANGAPPSGVPRAAASPANGAPSTAAVNEPADGPPTRSAAEPRRAGRYGVIPPPVRGARPTVPPQRRAPAPDDEPTEVHGDLAASVDAPPTDAPADVEPTPPATEAAPDFPGRHRRRAGASPDSRPAAEYKAQAAAARGGKKARPGRRRRENFWRELPLLIVVALVLTFTIQTFLAKVYVIPSGSMETTLHGCTGCNNDRVLVDKVTLRFRDPQPGDVVVFRGPDGWTNTEFSVPRSDNALVNGLQQFGSLIGLAPPDEKDFVKRVIAVGGQTVQCCDSRDRVMVDGEPLDEPYVYFLPEAGPAREQRFDPVTVPEGQLWMMGDSRNNSSDSRAQGHGPVPIDNVIGQARLIVLPLDRFGWIDSIDPQPDAAVGMAAGAAAGLPLAMGMLGTLPLAVWRRRRDGDRGVTFLP
ncbi:signal peptidase I [Pseudonocardia saturnea]